MRIYCAYLHAYACVCVRASVCLLSGLLSDCVSPVSATHAVHHRYGPGRSAATGLVSVLVIACPVPVPTIY